MYSIEDRLFDCTGQRCGRVPHRWRPSPEAGPGWRCSECGELRERNPLECVCAFWVRETMSPRQEHHPNCPYELRAKLEALAAERDQLKDEVVRLGSELVAADDMNDRIGRERADLKDKNLRLRDALERVMSDKKHNYGQLSSITVELVRKALDVEGDE
jgi:hypothetical protein